MRNLRLKIILGTEKLSVIVTEHDDSAAIRGIYLVCSDGEFLEPRRDAIEDAGANCVYSVIRTLIRER